MKKRIWGLSIICFTLLISIFYFLWHQHNNSELIYLNYGDSFSQVNALNSENQNMNFPKTEKKYQVVYYLDTRCKTCIDQLEIIRRLSSVLKKSDIELKILWKDKIKPQLINQYNLPLDINYYISNNSKLDTGTPTIYILDSKNTIIYSTIETNKIIKKIISLDGIALNQIKSDAVHFIQNEADQFIDLDSNKPLLVYFSLEGCSDCEKANSIIAKKSIQTHYNIFEITTKDYNTEDSDEFVDFENLFMYIFEIDWYPSFLKVKLEDKYEFIGETKLEDLETKILKN